VEVRRLLFPESRAYTACYEFSPAEAALYTAVTDRVRQEMNRVDRDLTGFFWIGTAPWDTGRPHQLHTASGHFHSNWPNTCISLSNSSDQNIGQANRMEGDGKRRANVGFALQTLQRRLASYRDDRTPLPSVPLPLYAGSATSHSGRGQPDVGEDARQALPRRKPAELGRTGPRPHRREIKP
jgi:hypothetical protein